MIKPLAGALAKALEYILSAALAILLGLTLWQVFARYVIGEPDTFTDELLRIVLMWFGMLAGSYCVWSRAHIGFDLLTKRISRGPRKVVHLLTLTLTLGITFAGLIVGGWRLVWLAAELDQRTPVMGLAMAQVYWILPISGVLVVIFLLARGIEPATEQGEGAI